MDREQARQEIKQNWEPIIQSMTSRAPQKLNGQNSYVCPICGHGTREHKQGIGINPRSKDRTGLKCFSCEFSGDILDLYSKVYEVDHNTALNALAARLNITIDPWTKKDSDRIDEGWNQHKAATASQDPTDDIEDLDANPVIIDFTPEVMKAHEALKNSPEAMAHFVARGIDPALIESYKFGYDAEGYNHFLQAHPENHTRSRKVSLYKFILPYPAEDGRYTYFLSEISDRKQIDEYNGKYRKVSANETNLRAQLFNERYIKTPPEVVYICEGIYDALSVESVGGKAIAFVGTAHRRFLSLCKKYRPNTHFVIALDNDEAGQKAIDRLKEGLDLLKIPYIVKTAENGKDFNEALQTDKEAFKKFIAATSEEAQKDPEAEKKKAEYLKNSAAGYIDTFKAHITESTTTQTQATGFSGLDRILDGGLKPGLYFIGAISSLGKTTLALQIADNIAAKGRDVLIFSLEMGKDELIAKTISRLTFLQADNERNAKTINGILEGARYKNYNPTEQELIADAYEEYNSFAHHVFIHEGVGDLGVKEIREKVQNHIDITGNIPVIFIDYLQILAPYSDRMTDKQNTDKSVLELRRIARDFKAPVVGISSFNRSSYGSGSSGRVSMSDFKESGAIEYGADVLIGLEFAAAGDDYNEQKEKAKDPREIRLVILKNRNYKAWTNVTFKYHQKFNYFEEAAIAAEGVKTYDFDDEIEDDGFKPVGTKGGGKRDRDRKNLEAAFNRAKQNADAVGQPVTLYALAELLDISQARVKNLMKELGGYVVEKDGKVQVSGEVDTGATVAPLP